MNAGEDPLGEFEPVEHVLGPAKRSQALEHPPVFGRLRLLDALPVRYLLSSPWFDTLSFAAVLNLVLVTGYVEAQADADVKCQ